MGSNIELNDTLQITSEQGFPTSILDIKKHKSSPITFDQVKDTIFEFNNKSGARIFHIPPTRCFLVHNIDGKWLYWGKILMLEQTINSTTNTTSGKYKVIELYNPKYQEQITKHECPEGKSYF